MKKTNVFSLFLLSLSTFSLSACGLGGLFDGDGDDVKLYSLTLTSNIELTDEQKAGLRIELIRERDEDDIASLKESGATDEDIAKSGKLQNDGKYYFFDQDPVYIYKPDVPGYNFSGFYVNNEWIPYHDWDNNPKDGKPDSWWNTLDKDMVVEARYEYLKYSITYCDDVINSQIPSDKLTNPTEFDGSKQMDVTLNDPQRYEGYEFQYWYYYEIISEGEDQHQEEVICTKLPNIGNENVIHTIGYSGDKPIYGLTLFAHYEAAKCNVLFRVDQGVKLSVREFYTGTPFDISHGSIEVKSGTVLDVWVDDASIEIDRPGYKFEGIYVNGQKIPDINLGGGSSRPINRTSVTIKGNTTIEIKVIESL